MTYLQLLEQLRSRDDRFRQSRVDQAVLESYRDGTVRQESSVPPSRRKEVEQAQYDYSKEWKEWWKKGWKERQKYPEPQRPNQVRVFAMGEYRPKSDEVVLASEPKLRSWQNKGEISTPQLLAHELRHRFLQKEAGIPHGRANHHPIIDAMETVSPNPTKYRDIYKTGYEGGFFEDYYKNLIGTYERELRDKANENRYLKLLKQMGYKY